MPKAKYKRILLKLSGEAISGEKGFGIDPQTLGKICDVIKRVTEMGVEVAIVVGGGNFWRGRQAQDIERVTADYMGMLATVMNGQALQDALEFRGIDTRLQLAFEIKQIGEPYIRRKAIRHLEMGRVVIFAGGTGNPFFSTDTCSALRASEVNAEVILAGKTIDGVYDDDPKKNPNAKKFDEIKYSEIIEKSLKVIDSSAASICMDNNILTFVFALSDPENIVRAVAGENIGTIIS